MDPVDPRDVVRHCHVFNSIHNSPKMSVSTTTASGGKTCSVMAELALEDLKRGVGRRPNDLGECPVRQGEVVTHLGIVLTVGELQVIQQQVGRPGQCI